MKLPFAVFALCTLLCVPAAAQTLTAKVNDPLSHGMVGDGKLSLDEAIQLVNGTLTMAQLSAAERAQLVGLASYPDTILVDAAVTPVISYERELTPTLAASSAPDHTIQGVAGPSGLPVLDAKGFSAALNLRTNRTRVDGFVLRGGKVGIDADTSGRFQVGDTAVLGNLVCEGQSDAGIRLRTPATPPGQQTLVSFHDITMANLPIGIDLQDLAQFGTLKVEGERFHLQGCNVGINAYVGNHGGLSSAEFFRFEITGADTCVKVRRDPTSDSEWFMRFVHSTMIAAHTAIDVEGTVGNTIMHHHTSLIRGGPAATDYAIVAGPRTARFDLHGSECLIEGNVSFSTSRNTRRIFQENNRYVNGSFHLDNEGVPPDIMWNHYESFPIFLEAASKTRADFLSCEMVRSPVTDLSTAAAVTLSNCFLGSSPLSNVTNNAPAPSPWLGSSTVTPLDPPLGTYVDLQVDLQPDLGAVWFIGDSIARPNTTNFPYRFYLSLSPVITVPQLVILQQRVRVPIPTNLALIGHEFYAQPAMVPLQMQSWVAPLMLPAGGRFVISR